MHRHGPHAALSIPATTMDKSMRIIIGLLTCLCICEWSQVLATDPTPPASTQVQSGQAPAPAESAAAASSATPATSSTPATATATAATSTAASGVSAEDDKRLRSAGYKRTVQNGQTYYCKSEQVLGSRFEHKVCRTPEQVSADRNQGRDETTRSQVQTYNAPAAGK
jgi:hypothetical protein